MTSALMPSAASVSAAARARSTMSRVATMVTSVPSRSTLALPSGAISPRVTEALAAVQALVLEEHRRVVVGDGRAQQAVGRAGRGRGHDAQPGQVHEPALAGGAVLGPEAAGAAADDPDRDRHGRLATGHEPVLGQLVDDGVAGRRQEVGEHDLDDRAQPDQAHPDGHVEEAVLADGRGPHALRPEGLDEPGVGLEHAAVGADVLAHEQDRRRRRPWRHGGRR